MLKKDLAEALGLSGSMVSRLAGQGMPTDSIAAAKRWRETHLSTARRKEFRAPSMRSTRTPAEGAADAAELAAGPARVALAHVQSLGRAGARLLAMGAGLAAIEPELRQALQQVPIPFRDRVRVSGTADEWLRFLGKPAPPREDDELPDDVTVPLPVWQVLLAEVLARVRADEAEMIAAGEMPPRAAQPPMTDDEAAWMDAFWYCAAAGEVTVPK